MDIENVASILFAVAFLSLGAFIEGIREKARDDRIRSNFHIAFYIVSIVVCILPVIIFFIYRVEIIKPHGFGIAALVLCFLSGIALFTYTYKYLPVKNIYNTTQLNPIVNDFTTPADKNEVQLFGGDLNFFGNAPQDMNGNDQYKHLIKLGFKSILILCESPENDNTKIRYGKILNDMPNTKLRFYHPKNADLHVRGRMIQVGGISKLLIYSKDSKPKHYRAIETDGANSNGLLYLNLWNLVWSMAEQPSSSQIQEFKELFLRH